MKVSDIMTHPVITVAPETTVGEAAELWNDFGRRGVPQQIAANGRIGRVHRYVER